MGAILKWLFGLILIVVVLIVAAVIVLPMVVDPNDYKPQIIETAKKKLGRDLSIEQDLNLSVFPWLGIETGGVSVGNAAGFSEQPFAQIEQLGVKVKLMPLLSKRVEVDTLVLKGLNVSLEKDANGNTNWEDLAGGPADSATADEPAADDGETAPLAFSIQGIQVDDARIAWDDRQAGQTYVLDGVKLVTGTLSPGEDVPVEAGVVFTSSQPAMTLQADLTATVGTDADMTAFRIAGLELLLDASGEGLPAGGAKLTVRGDLAADTKADTLRVDGLEISGPAMSASGEISVTALQSDPSAEGRLKIAETNPKTLASMFATAIETTDPKALTRVAGDIAFSYAGGALKLDPLTISLDDSKLDGHVHVLNPEGPVVRMKLALDQIDLDRYMPPAGGEEQPAAKADSGGAASAGDPFAALRPLDLVAEFSIGSLKVSNARMSNVTTKVVSRDGVLTMDPVGANLYDGKFNGRVVLNAAGKTPKVAAKNSLTGIQIGPLLRDVAGQDRLEGKGEFHVDVTLVGLSEAEVRRSLNGTSRFAFTDGALKGVNLAQIIRQGSQALGLGGAGGDTGAAGQTDFSELTGSVQITNGVVKNQDLKAKSPLLRVDGKGTVDLPQDTIDYLVEVELVKSLEGQGGKSRDELAGVPIPVRVSGPLNSPKFRPDLEAALSAKAKAQLDEKKEELREKAEEKIQESVGGALKGLFN